MGSGCTGQSGTQDSERTRLHRQGNLSFYIHGNSHSENLIAGKGCRKTVAWHTNLTKEEIEIKIKEFWDTRVEGNPQIWGVLKQACAETDPVLTEKFIKANGLTMSNGLLQQTFDGRNHRYDLPPFVINAAVRYGTKQEVTNAKHVKNELLKVKVRSTKCNDFEISVQSNEEIQNIKEKVKQELNENKRIRLFFVGRELTDGTVIGKYNLTEGSIVQVFFCD